MARGALTRNPSLCRVCAVLGIFTAVSCIDFAPAHAGCTSVLIPGGLQVDCSAATAPDPSVSPAIPSGDNFVQIFSGTYNGNFTIAGGNNSIVVTGGQLNGNFVTGTGADQFTMHDRKHSPAISIKVTERTPSPCAEGWSARCSRAAVSIRFS